MSNLGIFLTGAVVTMLVVGALLLLLWGAVMDGRQNDASDVSVEGGRSRVWTHKSTSHLEPPHDTQPV